MVTMRVLVVVLHLRLMKVVIGLSEEVATLLEDLCLSTRSALHSYRSRCPLILGNGMQITFGLATREVSGVMPAYLLQLVILNSSIAGH